MKKYYSFLLVMLFCSLAAAAQKLQVDVDYVTSDASADKPVIFYTPNKKLSWTDFKGKPVAASEAAAITNAGFGFKMAFHSEDNAATLHLTVDCTFSITDSWVKNNRKTPYILNHEQHHFDLAYLYAMQFVHNLKMAKYTMKDYNKVLEKIYTQCQTDLLSAQNAYDTETKNSQLADKQEIWDKKIDGQMSAYLKQ
jgi:hypothetical protein